MTISKNIALAGALAASFFLAACDSAEERAEAHYQSAVELLEAGDVDRAIVELRNVFQLNKDHVQARKLLASAMMDRGNIREAFGNYLYVSERLPEDVEARRALALIAFQSQDWEALQRHGEAAYQLDPQDPLIQALYQTVIYRRAVIDEDNSARRDAAREIEELRAALPDSIIIPTMLIDNALREQDFETALAEIDRGLEIEPGKPEFMQSRLGVLLRLQDENGIEEQLVDLTESFPESQEYRASLIRWYLSRGREDEAEAVLRDAAMVPDATVDERGAFIQFVRDRKGNDAALQEIEALIETGKDLEVLRALRASLRFDSGDRTGAIEELEALVEGEGDPAKLRDVRIALARMLQLLGDEVGARRQVEQVLSEDGSHVDALKMQAAWLTEQDRAEEAILALRRALDQEPRDPELMSLMATAHFRNGSRELGGEMLSLAVDTSGNAPAQTVRYARFLLEDGRLSTAESVLIESLRLFPNNQPILELLGVVYLEQEDWSRVEQVEGTLERIGTPESERASNTLRARRLSAQDRGEDLLGFLRGLEQNQGSDGSTAATIVRTYLSNGDVVAAEAYVDESLAADPGNRLMLFLKAGIRGADKDWEGAESIYRDLLAENATGETVWRSLYLALARQGKAEAAIEALNDGIAANEGRALNLEWALAGEYERAGQIDEAIEIYERLYELNSNSMVIANNLASLITTYKSDEENLDRAFTIARRLRGIEQPAFQDTYGWIALRRGQIEVALEHLEPAAAGLPEDPLVQFHLGIAYARAGRTEEAIAQLRHALEVAGPADTREQFATARAEIERLQSLGTDG